VSPVAAITGAGGMLRPRRSHAVRIAREELRWLLRHGLSRTATVLMLILMLAATVAALDQRARADSARERAQATSDQAFLDQPDRHPHRVVHYGQFALRPLGPLAFFDFGVDAYTGHLIYLEGHRQNSANFGDARQSSLLLRFGQLSPAFVLQLLLPLLIVLLAHAAIARERADGSLRLLRVQGVPLMQIVAGKLLAQAGVAIALSAPALIAVLAVASAHDRLLPAVLLCTLYLLHALLWVLLALLISLFAPRPREALLAGLSLWVVLCVALPRIAADQLQRSQPLPTRVATDIGVQKALAAIGDSHNPHDPYFSAFRQQVLERYGVQRIEDLPVNYGGLVMLEGERLTSELFQQQMQALQAIEASQAEALATLGWLSPLLALRPASMQLSGTDAGTHRAFLAQAERHRFAFVQALNTLHAEEIEQVDDRAQKLSRDTWATLPRFEFVPPALSPSAELLRALGVLLLWVVLLAIALPLSAARAEARP
jgi:ABC-2 type transport system permease protein